MAPRQLSPVRLGLLIVFLGAPLLFLPGNFFPYTVPKTVLLAWGAVILWLGAWLGEPDDRLRPAATRLDLPLAALLAAWTAAALLGLERADALLGHRETQFGLISAAAAAVLCLGGAALPEPDRRLPRVLLAASGALLGLHALLQAAGLDPLPHLAGGLPQGRAIATAGTPVFLGAHLAMAAPAAWAEGRRAGGRRRALAWAALALSAGGLWASAARGSILAAGAGLAVAWLASERAGDGRPRARRLGAAAAVLAGALAAGAAGTARPHGESDAGRATAWRAALLTARRYPWLGAGPEGLRTAEHMLRDEPIVRVLGTRYSPRDAHDDILHAAAAAGLLGLAAYLAVLWALAGALRAPGADAGTAGALAALFVHAKFNPAPASAWCAAALLAGAALPAPLPPPEAGRGRLRAAAALLVAALAAGFSTRVAWADRLHGSARRALAAGRPQAAVLLFERALRAAPWDLPLRDSYVRGLVALLPRASNPLQRAQMLDRGAELARGASAWHPRDAAGRQMLALVQWLRAGQGDPSRLDEAWAAVEEGRRLDPYHAPLLELGLEVARARGDQAGFEALAAETRRVERLLPAYERAEWAAAAGRKP